VTEAFASWMTFQTPNHQCKGTETGTQSTGLNQGNSSSSTAEDS